MPSEDGGLESPDVVGAHGPPLSAAVADLEVLAHGAWRYDVSLRVAERGLSFANVLGAGVVPVVLHRPRIAADPGLGERPALVVADDPGRCDRARPAARWP